MFSLMGFQARLIETFFRDDKLVLRPTKLYDFSHGNDSAFQTLILWYMGKAIEINTQGSQYSRWFRVFLLPEPTLAA